MPSKLMPSIEES